MGFVRLAIRDSIDMKQYACRWEYACVCVFVSMVYSKIRIHMSDSLLQWCKKRSCATRYSFVPIIFRLSDSRIIYFILYGEFRCIRTAICWFVLIQPMYLFYADSVRINIFCGRKLIKLWWFWCFEMWQNKYCAYKPML